MELVDWDRLLAEPGQQALALTETRLLSDEDELRTLQALHRSGADAPLARAAVDTIQLRRKAAGKFRHAASMYFTREALEQATSSVCAEHCASRFRGRALAVDLCCGIGGDSIGLAAHAPLLAVDRDALRLRMARQNVAVCQPSAAAQFVCASLESNRLPLGLPAGAAVFCDPSRREAGRRLFSVQDYSPPLARIDAWRASLPGIPFCIKASPGLRLEEIAGVDCEVEFLSVAGELKEAILWYGAFRTARRRATRLPDGISLTDAEPESDALSAPQEYLMEPDPSVLRAGLVRQLAARLSAARIDPTIAYLTASNLQPTPWARAFRLEEAMPFGVKRLREWLRERNVGRVVVKKRGSPIDPQDLERQLRLSGDQERVVFVTRVMGKPAVLIGTECVRFSEPAPLYTNWREEKEL
jgi:hypothetical protein